MTSCVPSQKLHTTETVEVHDRICGLDLTDFRGWIGPYGKPGTRVSVAAVYRVGHVTVSVGGALSIRCELESIITESDIKTTVYRELKRAGCAQGRWRDYDAEVPRKPPSSAPCGPNRRSSRRR